ncbi:hypothetical protein THASP1DRAFT_22223 [Thamnocephalis sphaerospora]|uniref:Tyrosinase copper-binding domain-containing protein n=1 Tax=Thamnocephalis sphaerospora TaxID=78915 RepID=A0A4P9XUV9_9FUNG|nr:hypothetical protein THASP1DRAFT_22223 [Thamnocephalis sphaerospora]|eukprot:RKP10025.1 hypothetical protein THASP1DRAFT_22223 [Thamnocephalis sphaerospora]
MKKLRSAPTPNLFDRFADLHSQKRHIAHGFAEFLPWHRALVYDLEKALRQIDPSIAHPYWDWSYDSQAPELSPVWHPDWYGGNGRHGDNCVTDGQWANWRPFYPQPHCLQRTWDNNSTMTAYYPPEIIQYYQDTAKTYDDFRIYIEMIPHSSVHGAIGGDMATMLSPNEWLTFICIVFRARPLFFLHHAFIDKVWADWQDRTPKNVYAYNGTNADGTPAQLSDKLTSMAYTVGDVIDTRKLCYVYEPFVGANSASRKRPAATQELALSDRKPHSDVTPSPHDRQNLYKLRLPIPLTVDLILLFRGDVDTIRGLEAQARAIIDNINKQHDYISPAALINRPDYLKRLAEKSKNGAHVHGRVDAFKNQTVLFMETAATAGARAAAVR